MTLKILAEFCQKDNKALLVELPQEVISQVRIAEDGRLNISQFLEVLKGYYQKKPSSGAHKQALDEYIDCMQLIFGLQAPLSKGRK